MLPITLLEYKMLPITLLEYKMLPITLLEYKMLPITLLEYKMLPITLLEYKMLPITLLEYKMLHIYDFPDLFWNCSDAVVFFVIIYLNTTFQTLATLAITWMYVNLFIVIFSHLYFCMHYD
jgi:hypothetical protein